MAWWFDRPLLNALTRNWDAGAIKDYSERVRRHEEAIPKPIAATFQDIDAKATGLLTHVSMMIAGLGLISPLVADHKLEEGVIVFEMAIYLLIAVGCLRCLTVFSPSELSTNKKDFARRISHEAAAAARALQPVQPRRHLLHHLRFRDAAGHVLLVIGPTELAPA